VPEEPRDYTLLPARMRQVATILREAGLDTHDFAWETVSSMSGTGAVVSRLVHVPTGYFFQFDWGQRMRPARFRPGRDAWREDVNFANVNDQITFFSDWRDLLIQQLEAGDPSAEFAGGDDLFEQVASSDNPKFTKADRAEFTRRLEAIRTILLDHAADDEEAKQRTNERIDYLIGAMERVGKRDWLFMAFGIILERSTEFALPNEQIRALLGMLARGIQQLTGS
jgi:hypothetical protein